MKKIYFYLLLSVVFVFFTESIKAAEWTYDFENIESLIGNRGPREAIDVNFNGLEWHLYGVKRNMDDQDFAFGSGSICLNGTLMNSSILAKETPNVTLKTMRSIGNFEFYVAAHDYWKGLQQWWIVQYSTDGSNWTTVGDAFMADIEPTLIQRRINQPSAQVRIVREDYATYDYTSGQAYEFKMNLDNFRITDYDGTAAPSFSANVASLDFGELTSGETKTLSFVLTHKNFTENINLEILGDDAVNFTLLTPEVSEGDETEISISCTGKRKGNYVAVFRASADDLQFNLSLTATGKIDSNVLFSGGSGTFSDPYLISDASDMVTLSRMVEEELNTFEGRYFLMTNDINMASASSFRPIGNTWGRDASSSNYIRPFSGTFDGGDHALVNMTVSGGAYTVGVAPFGYVRGATIKNLTIKQSSIAGYAACAGIVAAILDDGAVENCHVMSDVTVKADMYAAGIVGSTLTYMGSTSGEPIRIIDCTNDARINDFTAGASGIICSASAPTDILRCGNRGEITSTNHFVAGICETVRAETSIIDCYNTGALDMQDLNSQGGEIQTECRGGGIVATAADILYTDSYLTIRNCYGSAVMSESSTRLHQLYDGDEMYGDNLIMENNYYNSGYGNIFEKWAVGVEESVMKSQTFVGMLNGGTAGCWVIKSGENKGFPVPEDLTLAVESVNNGAQPSITIENGQIKIDGNYRNVTVYDMNGCQQSLSSAANGMYIIKIETDNQTIVKKIMK